MSRGFERPPRWAVVVMVLGAAFVAVGMPIALNRAAPAAGESAAAAAAPSSPKPVRVAILGDSYTVGSGAEGGTGYGYAPLTCMAMRWSCTILGSGGSSYTHDGLVAGAAFGKRLQKALDVHPDVLIVQGSSNDAPGDGVQQTASDLYVRVKTALPHTRLIVVGPVDPPIFPSSRTQEVRDELRAATTAAGVPFIDPIAEDWLPKSRDLFSADRHHPNAAGHRTYSGQLVADLEKLGVPQGQGL